MASDYKSLRVAPGIRASSGKKESDLSELLDAYLEMRKREAESGQVSVKTYSEHRQKLEDFRGFCNFKNVELVDELDEAYLDVYRAYQLELINMKKADGGISAVTAKKRLGTLKRFIEWAYERKHLDRLPRTIRTYAKIRLPDPAPLFYTPEEVKAIWNKTTQRTHLYIALGLNCGYTQKDIATLTHEMIDWETGIVRRKRHKTLGRGKSAALQVHKLWPITLELLKEETQSKTGLVLVGENGKPLYTESIKEDGNLSGTDVIRLAFNRAKKQAKIEDSRGFKHFRKSAANEIEKRFQNAPHLSSLFLAHSEVSVKKHYVESHYDLLFEALDYLDGLYDLAAEPSEETEEDKESSEV
ncbi:tyrosine-type recombinase/integrase [Bremerella alba]|nr:phage integrase SAM-like domain-containing protein [Bremerella alba]